MTHAQWHARLRRSLALVDSHPERALASFDDLLKRLHADVRKSVSEWHIDQTLEAISIVHSHIGDHPRAADTMIRLAERHAQQAMYFRRAVVSACASAALERASADDRRGALRALQKARPLAAGLRPQEKLFRRAEKAVAAMRRA